MKQLRLARPVRDEAHRTRGRNRIVRHFEPGSSTAVPLNVIYRLGKIRELGQRQIGFPVPLLPWLPGRIGRRFMPARNYWPHELRDVVRSEDFAIRTTGFVWPVLEVYPWLPYPAIRRYRNLVPIRGMLRGPLTYFQSLWALRGMHKVRQ